ncbi:MAG: thermonuclease family protein [Lentisphaeria bacterium]|nr:thermonuclease family protein [Lentisphaeria bacterium]
MATRKKSNDSAKAASKFVFGKIVSRSFFVVFLLICGGIIFNLDRITGNNNFRTYLPGFITRWLPAAAPADGGVKTVPTVSTGSENIVSGKVTSVYDGDTLTFVGNNAQKYKVRFFGIDAPEAKQVYGIESRDSLREKVLNKEVKLEIINTDRYGRSVCKVYSGARYINREMVAEGSAWYYPDYAEHEKDLEAAQELAKSARAGLWRSANPQPPWLYRKEMRNQ